MKRLNIWLIIAACSCLGADEPKGPLPIPDSRQEEISRVMLSVQAAQLHTRAVKDEAEKNLKAAMDAEERAGKAYLELEQKLQKEFHAEEGCRLNLNKTWDCPKLTHADSKTEGAKTKQ